MKWKDKLIKQTNEALNSDKYWSKRFEAEVNNGMANIHLAIFNEPFLDLMFKHEKTIESRFSINNVVPYNRVTAGDIVLVKRSGGSIEGIFVAENIQFFRNLTADKVGQLESEYGKKIGWNLDPEFLSNKSGARYLTLIGISHLAKIGPIAAEKKDKTGWAIVKRGLRNTLFEM
jgi:hypothetical protein